MSESLKKELTERDICTKYITPALASSGWDIQSQIREEVSFTAGRIFVHGTKVKRGDAQRADYVLYYKPNMPIAVIEAKDNNHSVGSGMQQSLGYADALDVPFAFSSNGDGFLEHDRTCREGTVEREIPLSSFPTPGELWKRYCNAKGIVSATESIIAQDYHADMTARMTTAWKSTSLTVTPKARVSQQSL